MSATGERTKPLARLVACRGRGSQADSVTGRPVLRLGGDNLTQDSPMTDQAISPLRRRMIEDMAIRKPAHVPAKWNPVRRQGHAPNVESTAFPAHMGSPSDPI
jgi:hypothetical protein